MALDVEFPIELRGEITATKPYDTQEGLAGFIVNDLAKGPRYRNRLVVDDVYILLGDKVDLALDFYARDDKTATQFIINELRRCYGVGNTTSAKISYSSKYGWLSKGGHEQDVSEVSDEE